MKGRKRFRAEKYDSSESLDALWEKAANGQFSDKALWMFRDAVFSDVDRRKKEEAIEALGWMLEGIISRKDWDELNEMRKIFVAHEKWDKQRFKVSDQLRCLLLVCNQGLHELAFLHNKTKVKAGDLLRLLRLLNGKLYLPEVEMDDACIFRIMRQLGLPRIPEKIEKGYRTITRKDRLMLEQAAEKLAVKLRWKTGK